MILLEETRVQKNEKIILNLIQNETLLRSIAAICLETFNFIHKYEHVSLTKILQLCQIKALDFWWTISNFAKFDRNIPESVREHLFKLEQWILLYYSWLEGEESREIVLSFFKNLGFSEDQYDQQLPQYSEILSRRLINHSALRLKEICTIIDWSVDLQEKVWAALKYIFH